MILLVHATGPGFLPEITEAGMAAALEIMRRAAMFLPNWTQMETS
jgi:hypothetical protein